MTVYDCFTYNGEADILDIRLNILNPYVDHFILVEGRETFSGKEKPIYHRSKEFWNRFGGRKIWTEVATGRDLENSTDPFERAGFQKDHIRGWLRNMCPMNDEDIIYFGDVDEIWTPQDITDDKVYSLSQLNYSYYLNNRSSEEWVGTVVGKWGTIKEKDLNYWRATHSHILDNGGWHFSNQGGVETIRKKLESYDHQEFNNPETRFLLEERMKNGEDYVGRRFDWQGKPFEFWEDESQLPKYLMDNREKYAHLFR